VEDQVEGLVLEGRQVVHQALSGDEGKPVTPGDRLVLRQPAGRGVEHRARVEPRRSQIVVYCRAMDHDRALLTRYRRALDEAYGGRLDRAILFGSRARGGARIESDYDVAVFLTDMAGFGVESRKLAEIETELLLHTGAVFNTMPFLATDYAAPTAFMAEVRRDGVDL
jgi:predicted nucleotidyltransferase